MATVIKTSPFSAPRIINISSISLKPANPFCLSFSHNNSRSIPNFSLTKPSLQFPTKTEQTIQEPEIEVFFQWRR
uniref:Uncharacterized protein n=1 Tax=Salix viminalis TaxID=40686 RepID=A0A6N2LGW5_SALVM